MRTNTAKSQWLSYSGQATDEWSGGIATFSNGDIATAFSVSKSNGTSSVIVQRLNTNGVVVWSLDIGADYAPSTGSVLVGADDKVYVTGGTKQGSAGESGKNDSDIFAVALSPTGQKLWYKNYGIGVHEIGSSAVLDGNGNILLEGRVSEVNDRYSFIKDVPYFYGAEFSGGWRGFQLRINPADGTVEKAYTTGSGNSGGGPIAIDQSRNISFVAGYTFGAANGVNTVGNGDPNGANTYLIARNETTGTVLWTRMENWMRSNVVAQESENAIYFVDKGNLEKVNGSTGQTIWSKALANTGYTLSPIAGGGVLLSESESNGSLTIRRFDANGIETGSQVISHTGTLHPRAFIEQGDGTIQISGSTSGEITVDEEITVVHPKQAGRDAFVLNTNSAFSVAHKATTPVVRGNSIYTIVDGPSWTQAEAKSVELGGHLVALSSAEEQKFVVDYIESIDNSRPWWWMGLGYDQSTNTFQWFNGENNTYRNWFQGNGLTYPDVSLAEGIYGYTEFTADPGRNWTDATADQGQWAVALPSSERQGVAEIPFIRRGDSAYVIIEGPTWEEAEANANALGGYLVTINDAEENKWLIDNIGHGKWIGINDKAQEGIFTWSSGETVGYTNWAQGEPNNSGGMQDYGWLQFEDGRWDDEGNIGISGIAEIKLAPNNTPTGLPTLLADLKVGQVISIDRAPIQDADNFEGWTPTYQYSWEIANDPGLTQVMPIWKSLTTADATDGDENLEITDDLTGKLIRGVVSYVDGYGTNESVYSSGAKVEASLPTLRLITLPTDLTAKVGQIIEVPITINQAQDLQALDLNFAFDPELFSVPTSGDLVRAGSLTSSWTFTGNLNTSTNTLKVSGFSSESLSAVSGDLAYLRLQVKGTAPRGEALLDLISASLNENQLSVELQDGSLTVTAPKVSIASDLKASIGGSIGIPITIDDATDLQSIDLVFAYDPTIFSVPASGEIISSSNLTGDWSFAANTATPGQIKISGYGTTPLEGGEGGLVNLNLKINSGVDTGSVLLDLVSASFNEGAITADLVDGTLELLPPTFQVMDVRQTASGLALKLSEAPDLEKLNLYDGQDASVDLPDLRLTRSDGTAVDDLSVHWKVETSELYVIHTDSLTGISQNQFGAGASPFQSDLLASGDYTLVIDARSDGLVSASSGELIDGNGDGITGDAFSYSFTKSTPSNLISIADTARGSGQSLGLNGIAQSNGINGLPVLISTSAAIRSLRGTVTYDATAFNNASLVVGRDLPEDWTLETQEDLIGLLNYTASGTTAITGTDQELFRFDAVVSQDATYGSSTLIEATVEAPDDLSLDFESDPSLVVLAYSGDTTGNGTLSSLDASRVQRVVVDLDSGFDAYDDINPVLVGDTTGNGSLSSLDAARIQQKVVGLAVDSFPIP